MEYKYVNGETIFSGRRMAEQRFLGIKKGKFVEVVLLMNDGDRIDVSGCGW